VRLFYSVDNTSENPPEKVENRSKLNKSVLFKPNNFEVTIFFGMVTSEAKGTVTLRSIA